MDVIVRAKGIFCDNSGGGLVNIKGTLTIEAPGAEPPLDFKIYSTLDGHQFAGSNGDARPIALAQGDLLLFVANFGITLRPGDFFRISGNILGGFSSLTITSDELVNISRPKAFHLRFAEGSQSVRAQFEVEKESALRRVRWYPADT
jgi:hypothetical protein